MIVNVTKLEVHAKIARREDTRENKDRRVLELRIQNEDLSYPYCPMWHSQRQIDQLMDSLRGEVRWHETVSWSDGMYFIKSGMDGLVIIKREGRGFVDHWFTFPGAVLAKKIQEVMDSLSTYYTEAHFEFTEGELKDIVKRHAPRIRIDWASQEIYEQYKNCMSLTPPMTEENKAELVSIMKHLCRIAKNRSDGDVVTIRMIQDPAPHSFYWTMHKNGIRFYNGGIIAHPNRDDDGDIKSYKFSSHT